MQLINEARTKVLLNRVGATADAHIHSIGCFARPIERLVNAASLVQRGLILDAQAISRANTTWSL